MIFTEKEKGCKEANQTKAVQTTPSPSSLGFAACY